MKLPILASMALMAFAITVSAQQPDPSPSTLLTKPTVLVRPSGGFGDPTTDSATDVVNPLADTARPDLQSLLYASEGVLIRTEDGKTVLSQAENVGFNPASAVKLATSLAALKSFGPDHRFDTGVWTNGNFDKATGTITGDLILSGRDPSIHYEHVIEVARELNRMGVRTVTGDLIVPPKFTVNFDWSSLRSGGVFYDTLDSTRRGVAATRAWNAAQTIAAGTLSTDAVPSVAVMGAVYVGTVPPAAKMLLVHRSSKLVDILKVMLCYSNNFMAERLGESLGGPDGVRRTVIAETGAGPEEIRLSSTSGLGVNRVTPNAMLKIYGSLLKVLDQNRLTISDILPVAGVDPGTLSKRYTDFRARGSVIAKTGTLTHTDGGVSALVGQMKAADGETLYFVIFDRGTNIRSARNHQDTIVGVAQSMRGGPQAFAYKPLSLELRLADTLINSSQTRTDEYEPGQN